jgi:hypothetical protein
MKSLGKLTKSTRRRWGKSSWKTSSRGGLGGGWGSRIKKRSKRGGFVSRVLNLGKFSKR